MELVTGATGYIGGLVVERLASEGRPVRAVGRDPRRIEPRAGVERVRLDLLEQDGVAEALDGCATAYYLVHSLERGGDRDGDFADRDRRAARNFVAAARAVGLERAVYLGGTAPPPGTPDTQVVGQDWTQVVIAGEIPLQVRGFGIREATTPVSGAWGSGRLLHTNLANVLFLSDGRVVAGFVSPSALEAAVAHG